MLSSMLLELGTILAAEPILLPSGRYDPQEELPRPYNDVLTEHANQLSTMHAYVGWARVDGREAKISVAPVTGGSGWRAPASTTDGRPQSNFGRVVAELTNA